MKRLIVLCLGLGIIIPAVAQQVGIGTLTPNSSAQLDVSSTEKGMLVPRMTAAQRVVLFEPATGLLVYQTDGSAGFYYNNGTPRAPNWLILLSSGGLLGQSGISLNGNSLLSVFPTSSLSPIPGLTHSINVPGNSIVYMSTQGGVQSFSVAPGSSLVDIALHIDGIAVNGARQRIVVANNDAPGYWSMSHIATLTPGSHNIFVGATGVNIFGNMTVGVSGNNSSLLQGKLSVFIMKQ